MAADRIMSSTTYDSPGTSTLREGTHMETSISGFTAVNGRNSPPQDAQLNGRTEGRGQPDGQVRPQFENGWQQTNINIEGGRSGAVASRDFTPPRDYRSQAYTTSPGRRKRSDLARISGNSLNQSTSPEPSPKRRDVRESRSYSSASSSVQNLPEQNASRASHQDYPPLDTSNQYGAWRDQRNEDSNEARLVAALQRGMELQHRTSGGDVPDELVGTPRSTIKTTAAGVQVDPKKRKRIFSNRTKTGCGTCRQRKKKCDEKKPECNNCIRGGFICSGYMSKTPWPKSGQQKMPPVRLQPSDTGGLFPRPPRTNCTEPRAQPTTEGTRSQPALIEEERRHPEANGGWSNSGWGPPTHRPYAPDHRSNHDYGHDLSPVDVGQQRRDMPDQSEPSHTVHRPQSQTSHASTGQIIRSSPAVTAQLALQHQPSVIRGGHNTLPPLTSEKDKMLAGEPYMPFSSTLVDDREQCKAALWRFNNAVAQGAHGVSREERTRHFRAVLEPATIPRPGGSMRSSLGRDVAVEAPFTCEYGYNIRIADDVVIGPNCTISDPCVVNIGPRCVFGPDVKIYGNTRDQNDTDRRAGSRGLAVGRRIDIESDVLIEGNVTITPPEGGIVIGHGSTITAGSVVTTHVPKATVFGGNPASVLRGVWGKDRR